MNYLKNIFKFLSIVLIGVGVILCICEFLLISFLGGLGAPVNEGGSVFNLVILGTGLLIKYIIERKER